MMLGAGAAAQALWGSKYRFCLLVGVRLVRGPRCGIS